MASKTNVNKRLRRSSVVNKNWLSRRDLRLKNRLDWMRLIGRSYRISTMASLKTNHNFKQTRKSCPTT